jgi:serine/threonine protein kinase
MVKNMSTLIGENLGSYKIIGKLGQGGMATVFKAHESSLNRMVALKVLSPHLSEDADFIKRFQREAQAAAQLNHPHIVQVYAIGEEQGMHFFSMEYIKGETLAQVIKKEKQLPLARAISVVRQVAEALDQAHQAGMVHRDIKPSNIMIDAAGRAKVTDFGIAHLARSQTKLTREGSVIGTPEYLSPEQCAGQAVDARSDIYSLGVTFYEMLTGKTPYETDTPVSMMLKIVKGEFPPLRQVAPQVPTAIQEVVEKMMATDRERRYQDTDRLIAALDTYEKGRTAPVNVIFAAPETLSAATGSNRRRTLSALAVAAVIVLLLGGAFAAKLLHFGDKSPADSGQTEIVNPSADAALGPDTPRPPGQTGEEPIDQAKTGESLAEDRPKTIPPAVVKGKQERAPAKQNPISQPRPPANSMLVTMIGDDHNAEFITAYLQSFFSRNNFLVVDGPSVAERNIAAVARYHLVVSSKLLATTTLNYYGHSSELYTVALTIKAVAPQDGRIVVGPFTRTAKFTAINAEEKLKEAVGDLARQVQGELNQ